MTDKFKFWNPDNKDVKLVMLEVDPLKHDFWINNPPNRIVNPDTHVAEVCGWWDSEDDDFLVDPFARDIEASVEMSETTFNILYSTRIQKQ